MKRLNSMNIVGKTETLDGRTIFKYRSNCDRIKIEVRPGLDQSGNVPVTLESNLRDEVAPEFTEFHAAIDGLEQMLMTAAANNIDLGTREWHLAIEEALTAICNKYA